ncbi:MAG: NUDIX domain-containing protein [Dehalococcoidia bacterium]|nr:NUDIX domain-containing protein [Dehalococcoidia bacterium]
MPIYQNEQPSFRVVTCFLMRDEKILILKRSNKVGTFRGKWAALSGFVESYPQHQALTEIHEETRLEKADIELVKAGIPFEVEDEENSVTWVIHPYLYQVVSQKEICIDEEHFEFEWIEPDALSKYDTVPGLEEALARVTEVDEE